MRNTLLLGTALAALCTTSILQTAKAAKLDDVMERLNALERTNAKLAKENAQLRERVSHIETVKPGAAAAAPASTPKGNPVQPAGVAPSPPPAPSTRLSASAVLRSTTRHRAAMRLSTTRRSRFTATSMCQPISSIRASSIRAPNSEYRAI